MLTRWFSTGLMVAVLLCGGLQAQVTQRVNVTGSGAQAAGWSYRPCISADGRYVVFDGDAWNLVPGDTNGMPDVFVRDRLTGTTENASLGRGGMFGNWGSGGPSISADGRFVAFVSLATNLVRGDTNDRPDIFVRDRLIGTTERVSVDSSGIQGNGDSSDATISADGRFVVFTSSATNLVSGDTNLEVDVFVHDRQTGTTERVSVDSSGAQADGGSETWSRPSISSDGRFVAFASWATNLVDGDTNGNRDVFVRDRQSGTTERVSVSSTGEQAGFGGESPSISADGRYVAFYSSSADLVIGDTNGFPDVFVRDRQAGTTELASLATGGAQVDGTSYGAAISADGRIVVFNSFADNLAAGDTNDQVDTFIRDRLAGTTERASVDSSGRQGNDRSYDAPFVSADGRYVVFDSWATNLVMGDTNGTTDIFLRDRLGGPTFTTLCDPGAGGVLACPCSNPPSGPGRGCDNSSGTGGAVLAASGGTYLSSDSLVFTTTGERATALTVLFQARAPVSSGIVYGQGVRCAGGVLKRLYSKSASGGSITVPDFDAGEPTVSSRSAAKGDPILAGESRWYFATYRDPIVLGGCPMTSTFNTTPTGEVTWAP